MEQYLAEQKSGGNWSVKTAFEVSSCLELLKEFLGDIPVSQINHAAIREYKKALLHLPPNRSKLPQYRDKTIRELLAMTIPDSMSITSVNKYIRWASALFKWATQNGFLLQNPAEGMKVKQPLRDDEFRDPFSPDDLRKIFHSHEYTSDTHIASYSFWVPVIGLFTGARLNEICQLYLDDIYQENGVWIFDFNEKTPDKSLKTKAAKRRVPLSPCLVNELKLPQYIESLREKGEDRLFPELKHKREGYGTNVSRWFARYKKRCGILAQGGKKDFHSFRSTVANHFKQIGIEFTIIHEVLGHANQSISLSRYADPYYPGVLLEKAVSKLDYGLDLSHLKGSRYAGKEGP